MGFSRTLTQDGQLRWIGPEKGVLSMACGAILNGTCTDRRCMLMTVACSSRWWQWWWQWRRRWRTLLEIAECHIKYYTNTPTPTAATNSMLPLSSLAMSTFQCMLTCTSSFFASKVSGTCGPGKKASHSGNLYVLVLYEE